MRKIKVLIVDDSELIRQLLTQILSSAPDIEVVGVAEHPYDAREKIKQLNPDVLTLDVEMPKMDGISFLRNLMRLRPMPVVMISTLTERGAPATMDALEIGAVDYVTKPQGGAWQDLQNYTDIIQEKVRNAASANMDAFDRAKPVTPAAQPAAAERYKAASIICIGSSTGGTEAIREVLSQMPENCPPIVMSQHIPATFSTTFAARLDKVSRIRVFEACDGQVLEAGCAYLAPGDHHLKIVRDGVRLITRLDTSDKVNGHRPSVDVMFDSVLEQAGKNTVAAVLTGMGNDGAQGMKRILEQGGHTVVQDEATSIVWGMPGAAFKLGAAEKVLPLNRIAPALLDYCRIQA